MRITQDKNGDPFGFCDANCAAQLRIGGSPHRVAAFRRLYPWAGPVTVTGTAPAAQVEPEQVREQEQEKKAPAKRAPFGLEQLMGGA